MQESDRSRIVENCAGLPYPHIPAVGRAPAHARRPDRQVSGIRGYRPKKADRSARFVRQYWARH
ncbi:hypothetical protein ABD05_32795 [Burkholderia pyrrocinia]|nr:hypothetical protein ABD05_32795 [Burkholderia pyrrocinia]